MPLQWVAIVALVLYLPFFYDFFSKPTSFLIHVDNAL